jgi:hypothetical protein
LINQKGKILFYFILSKRGTCTSKAR